VRREPHGVVLIIGTWNYPLLLPGVQALQALVAGNAVLLKPGCGVRPVAEKLAEALAAAGLPPGLLQVLDERAEAAERAIDLGVDKIVLTGSAATGVKVLERASAKLTPAAMELSGCDAVHVLDSADAERVAQSLTFGLRFNSSATCIAPRRVFVARRLAEQLETRLAELVSRLPPVAVAPQAKRDARAWVEEAMRHGVKIVAPVESEDRSEDAAMQPTVLRVRDASSMLESDIFAPVLSMIAVDSPDEALEFSHRCPYALGAAVFGAPDSAQQMAERIDAGCVTVNDLIVPTADPRVPFGGRKRSGFGVTRGREGLLEMTRIKTVLRRRGRWLPHLAPPSPRLADMLSSYLQAAHAGSLRDRIGGVWQSVKAAWVSRKFQNDQTRKT